MSTCKPKALMTQYVEGCLISRELQDMMVDYARENDFDREMADDVEATRGGELWGKYSQTAE